MRKYRELIAWQVGFDLARRIYLATEAFPKSEAFGLAAQMRRAAVSIPSNVAEGAGRATRKDFCHFVVMAIGSLNELEAHYLLAVELGMLRRDGEMEAVLDRLYGLLNGLRNSLASNANPGTLNAQRST